MQEDLVNPATFKDHFSEQAKGYARHRPTYPSSLIKFLADASAQHTHAWDCATGNGQVAVALAEFFERISATDASESQIDSALAHERVQYSVSSAEASGLAGRSIDLVTVGQAFHWFDGAAFFSEASRVLRPNGVLAIWSYQNAIIDPACDVVVDRLYDGIVGDYWPPERAMIEGGYADVELPGLPLTCPDVEMRLSWNATDMLGYLRTWSACKRYERDLKRDPVDRIEAELIDVWGSEPRDVRWPLVVKASLPNQSC